MFLCGLGAKNEEQESFFGSRFIFRAGKTENPVPRSFFAPKLNGNVCYDKLISIRGIGLKKGQISENQTAHPTTNPQEYPPNPLPEIKNLPIL